MVLTCCSFPWSTQIHELCVFTAFTTFFLLCKRGMFQHNKPAGISIPVAGGQWVGYITWSWLSVHGATGSRKTAH
jgi:hypothetical protein